MFIIVAMMITLASARPEPGNDTIRPEPPRQKWENRYQAISMPAPEYPYEARRRRISGDGVIAVDVSVATGEVTAAVMRKSTGSELLDEAAVRTARRWRFRPQVVRHVDVPVSFTIRGVALE